MPEVGAYTDLPLPDEWVPILESLKSTQPELDLVPVEVPAGPLLEMLLAGLDQRQREILKLRWQHKQTLQEVADGLKVTRERVRQIEKKALRKSLENSFSNDKLRGFYLLLHRLVTDHVLLIQDSALPEGSATASQEQSEVLALLLSILQRQISEHGLPVWDVQPVEKEAYFLNPFQLGMHPAPWPSHQIRHKGQLKSKLNLLSDTDATQTSSAVVQEDGNHDEEAYRLKKPLECIYFELNSSFELQTLESPGSSVEWVQASWMDELFSQIKTQTGIPLLSPDISLVLGHQDLSLDEGAKQELQKLWIPEKNYALNNRWFKLDGQYLTDALQLISVLFSKSLGSAIESSKDPPPSEDELYLGQHVQVRLSQGSLIFESGFLEAELKLNSGFFERLLVALNQLPYLELYAVIGKHFPNITPAEEEDCLSTGVRRLQRSLAVHNLPQVQLETISRFRSTLYRLKTGDVITTLGLYQIFLMCMVRHRPFSRSEFLYLFHHEDQDHIDQNRPTLKHISLVRPSTHQKPKGMKTLWKNQLAFPVKPTEPVAPSPVLKHVPELDWHKVDQGILLWSTQLVKSANLLGKWLKEHASGQRIYQVDVPEKFASPHFSTFLLVDKRIGMTKSGRLFYQNWTTYEWIEFVAWELAEHGFYEWHFSEMAKALKQMDPERFNDVIGRNIAAVLSRTDVDQFQQAGRRGCWKLKALGDGYSDNKSAIQAILESEDIPLHHSVIFKRLQRNIRSETMLAVLVTSPSFLNLGNSIWGLANRTYQTEHAELTWLLEHLQTKPYWEAEELHWLAEKHQLNPDRVRSMPALCKEVFYLKGGSYPAAYMTLQEYASRRFERWFHNRLYEGRLEDELFSEGIKQHYEAGNISLMLKIIKAYQELGYEFPDDAQDYVLIAEAHQED